MSQVLAYTLLIVVAILNIVLNCVKCQQYEGDYCQTSGKAGTCKLISTCPSAIYMVQVQQIPPQICGFKGSEPIVCCASDGPNTPRPVITTKATTPTTRAIRVTPKPTMPTTRPPPPVYSRIGDKARAKCIEYEQYAYVYATVGGPPSLDCVIQSIQNIVGGVVAQAKEFPHMALIGFQADDEIKWHCGGSLISERFIVTASHCLSHPQYGEAKYVKIGDYDLSIEGEDEAKPQQFNVVERIKHPDFKPPSRYNDIALIKFDKAARLNNYARPACLETDFALNMSIKATASGWGTVGYLQPTSKILLKVNLEYFTHDECYKRYKSDIGIKLKKGIDDLSQVCAGSHNESKDACQGDSGGPLQIRNTERICMYNIVGVTSFGKGCGVVGIPGVYTRISNYIEWIEGIVWP